MRTTLGFAVLLTAAVIARAEPGADDVARYATSEDLEAPWVYLEHLPAMDSAVPPPATAGRRRSGGEHPRWRGALDGGGPIGVHAPARCADAPGCSR